MSGPRSAEMLQKYGHAGGHLRDALLEALDHNEDWWKNITMDFYRERHNLWWNDCQRKGVRSGCSGNSGTARTLFRI